jgi:DNA polymerase-1
MLAVDAWLQPAAVDAKIIMQVHDELVFEIAETQLEDCILNIKNIMCGAAELNVPLVVDVGVGENWDEAH